MFEELTFILNMIINQYLTSTYCVTFVTEKNVENYATFSNVPYLHYSNASDSEHFSTFILQTLDMGCSDYIISMVNPETFVNVFEENVHITNQRRGNRKLIFVPPDDELETRERMIELLNLAALEFIPDVLLILPTIPKINNEDIAFEFYTQKYVGKNNNNDHVLLDKWNTTSKGFVRKSKLFPDKMSNMEGRIVRAATFNYKPYSILKVDKDENVIYMDGTEMRTGIEFCRWSNCELVIVRDEEHEWGEIWDNRSGNGIIGNVVTDKADFGYGALYSWYHEYGFLDLSMPVVRTGITCIAPAPSLVASWLLPVLPFNKVMWSCVLGSIVYSTIAVYITAKEIKKPFSFIQCLLEVVGIIVLQPPSVKSPPPALRQVINLLFLFTLMLTNVYSSGLASSITVPIYETPIDTVQQLVESNLDWGATHDAWIFSILDAIEPEMIQLVSKFKKWPNDRLKSKGKTRDFAYSVERLPAGHFAIGEYVTEEAVPYLQLMMQDIYWEQCVLMLRKSSPFTKRINKLLGRLHQSGLLHAWETQVVLEHSNYVVQLGVHMSPFRRSNNDEPHPLTTRHLQGTIMLWGLGAVLSTAVFIGELLTTAKKRKLKRDKNDQRLFVEVD